MVLLPIKPGVKNFHIVRAKQFLDAMEQPFEVLDSTTTITTSIGIALCPEHGFTFRELFMNADRALYRAKQKGKNCCVEYTWEM